MAVPVLSARKLNRAVLARQLLLERSTTTLPLALEAVAGLQTQYAPTGYIGLWSRLAGFEKGMLTDALHAGDVVQGWAVRCTIHMLSARDHPIVTEAVRTARRESWLRTVRPPAGLDMEAVADAVRGYLADGPLKQAELQRRLLTDGYPKQAWQGAQLWCDLVRVPPAGTWATPRAHVYGLAPEPPPVGPDEAREHLARRYLGGFGPASVKDVALFCGWPNALAKEVLGGMDLRRLRDEAGGELLDLPDAPLPDPDTPAPVRFLGPWEAPLLVHARRALLIAEHHRPLVFAVSMPQSRPTFLVDGRAAGTWKHVDGAVQLDPWDELPGAVMDEIRDEAERLAEFYRPE